MFDYKIPYDPPKFVCCVHCGIQMPIGRANHLFGIPMCDIHYNKFKYYTENYNPNPVEIYPGIYSYGAISLMNIKGENNSTITTSIDTSDLDIVRDREWKLYPDGFIRTIIAGKDVGLHRMIMNQRNPRICVDHIDQNKLNNCRYNLRIASNSQVHMNSNAIGVYRKRNGKFCASITFEKHRYNLGTYDTAEEAIFARYYAETKLFAERARPKYVPDIGYNLKMRIANKLDYELPAQAIMFYK